MSPAFSGSRLQSLLCRMNPSNAWFLLLSCWLHLPVLQVCFHISVKIYNERCGKSSLVKLTGNHLKLQFISFQQFHSLIISFCLNTINPPPPKSMLFVVKETIEGLKYNIDLGGGVGIHRGRGKICPIWQCKKGPFYRSVSTLLSLIVP